MNTSNSMLSSEASQPLSDDQAIIGRQQVINVVNPGDLPIQPGLFRVVWANRKSEAAFLLRFPDRPKETEVSTGQKRIKPKLGLPTRVNLSTLEDLARKHCVITNRRAILPRRFRKDLEELTKYEKKVRTRRKTLVSSFVADQDMIRILEYRQMGAYVARAVAEHNAALQPGERPTTRYHVYQTVYRFWLFGAIDKALIADSGNCGARGKYRNPGTAKRGRPRRCVATGHDPTKIGINTKPDVRTTIWLAWEAYGSKLGQYTAAYQKMVENYFSEWRESEQGTWEPIRYADQDCPSLEIFRYYVKRKYEPIELLKRLIPVYQWQRTRRALKGHTFDALFGPAQTYLIDATVADVYLVSVFNRFWIIGRPIVYFVRDAWSGMIVGLHVALEGPSWATARMAIYNACSRKGAYLRFFGFNMTDDDWPCAHGCLNLIHDRGELLSIPSNDSAKEQGFALSPCPSLRPDTKGAVETLFHWNNKITVHWLPGAVVSRQRDYGEHDCRLDATLTLYEFTRILIHAVLTFNRTADVSDRLTGPIAGLEIDARPINLWRWGLANLNGSPPEWDEDTLYNALLPSGTASIRADGIHFAGHRYRGDISEKGQWQEIARSLPTPTLQVKYNPNDPAQILVLNEATAGYERLSLAPGEQIPEHSRLEEILDCLEFQKLLQAQGADLRMLDRVGHNRFRDEEVKKAKSERANSIPPVSKKEHLAHTREHREIELSLQRLAEKLGRAEDTSSRLTEPSGPIGDDTPADLLSFLLAESAREVGHG